MEGIIPSSGDWEKFALNLINGHPEIYREYLSFFSPKPNARIIDHLLPIMDHYHRNFSFYEDPFNKMMIEAVIEDIIGAYIPQ
jgi:hypothetical protein